MIGSDGLPTLHGKPHPRLYGTFARVLGTYAREQGVLSLAEAVHRMTGFPARKFGFADRGEVRAGRVRGSRRLRSGARSRTSRPTPIRTSRRPASRTSS